MPTLAPAGSAALDGSRVACTGGDSRPGLPSRVDWTPVVSRSERAGFAVLNGSCAACGEVCPGPEVLRCLMWSQGASREEVREAAAVGYSPGWVQALLIPVTERVVAYKGTL